MTRPERRFVTWNLTPEESDDNSHSADGRGQILSSKAVDRIAVSRDVIPAVPIGGVWAATLARVGNGVPIPVACPEGTIAGTGLST